VASVRFLSTFKDCINPLPYYNALHTVKNLKFKFNLKTPSEIRNFTGLRQIERTTNDHATYLPLNAVAVPKSVDWRDKGYVTPVKTQVRFILYFTYEYSKM